MNELTDVNQGKVAIHEKLMVVRLNCSFSWGNTTDSLITAEVNAQKQTHALKVKKELLPGSSGIHLRELQATLSKFYGYHKKVTMSSLNEGERLLPVAFYLDYMQEFGVYQQLVQERYQEFKDNYAASVTAAQGLLGPAWNAADYPDPAALDRVLRFRVTTLPLPVADTLLKAVGDSIQEDVNTYLQDAMQQGYADVTSRIRDALERMVKQLGNPKGRIFDSMTEGLMELVSFIPEFNVTSDDSLSLLAEEIKSRLLLHSTEILRSDPVIRGTIAGEARDILEKMQ